MSEHMSYEEARKALAEYMERTGKNQVDVAQAIGKSDGLVSAFMSGNYKAPHAIIPLIERLLEISEQLTATPKEPEFAPTSISKQVISVIEYCHLQGKIGVAYGDAGVGKTMACREYVSRHPEAIMITIVPCFSSISAVSELLADALSIKESMARRIFTKAVHKLRGGNCVIIIDEAQHLTEKVINYLRSITDASGVGIAFVGNDEIYTKMLGTNREAYAQLYSRIGRPAHVQTSNIDIDDTL